MHASYHTNGRFHWKTDTFTQELVSQPPLPNIPGPVLMMSATTSISDDVLGRFKLAEFRNRRADRVIFMDNRMLPENLHYEVWAVPPFKHGDVCLMTNHPAHIHISTHTNPWIEVVIYEQGPRKK